VRIQLVSETPVYEMHRDIIVRAFLRAGIPAADYSFSTLQDFTIDCDILVPLGEAALQQITGKSGITKWHCSILKSRIEYGGIKAIPLLHPGYVFRNFTESFYIAFGALRIKEESEHPKTFIAPRDFRLNPSFEETLHLLNECLDSEYVSIDVETGRGQINTFGVTYQAKGKCYPTSVAIQTLPERLGDNKFKALWMKIAQVCESPSKKILQNFIYDTLYLSRYGIYVENIHHDTMWAMKFLHPEMESGLHNVGRIYTKFPYWKEDGKDWGNVRNWQRHFEYNCKDTSGTYIAYFNQRTDLQERALEEVFSGLITSNVESIREMCTRGLRVNEATRERIQVTIQREADRLLEVIQSEIGPVNPRSPAQLKTALKSQGLKIPVVKGKETTDKKALIKLKKKYPKKKFLGDLVKLSGKNKLLSSYINFQTTFPGRATYTLNGCATETGRWNSKLDPWGGGFNAQTVPKSMRRMFTADSGKVLIEIDLMQAESRYVAWDAPEPTLMELINARRSIHKFVAARIFKIDEDSISKSSPKYALGKKAGHGANYGVGARTFADQCFTDVGVVLSEREAKNILDSYRMEIFPGIHKRQLRIQDEIKRTKKLVTPLGRERIFYDRIGDNLFREAYPFCPQSVIPDITNFLVRYLYGHCDLLLQVHDSILLQVEHNRAREIIQRAEASKDWHPEIHLAGGQLVIPVDISVGDNWGELETV